MDVSIYSTDNIAVTSPYIRLVHRKTKKVADFTNGAMVRSITYAHGALALTKDTAMNGYPIDLQPYKAWLLEGDYDILVCDNASPADTDLVKDRGLLKWTGSEVWGGRIL